MKIGETINVEEFKKGRIFDTKEMIDFLMSHRQRFWCWGSTAWRIITNNKEQIALRFEVSGLLFQGHVYIRCNYMDNIDVYFVNTTGTIVNTLEDIGIENLFDCMDEIIEIKRR